MTGPSEDLRFGPYRVLRELGRGGQGVIYLAEDTRLRRKVALKVLSHQVLTDTAARIRFEREADVTARLEHPGICPLYERGETAGAPWIAMRYIEGEALDERLQREGASPDLPSVLRFFERAARALHVAHEAGLVHRDIKPGNLMAGPDGAPVILDFGLARDLTADQALTQTGQTAGTPAYMSPEQLQRHPLDQRTDIWSLGATLYEAVTGRRPFDATTLPALFDSILFTDPPDPRQLRPSLPPELSAVLATALEKDPARRYQSAQELADDLARVRRLEPVQARPASAMLRLRRWVQRNPAGAVLYVLMAAGLAVTALLLRHSQRALGREKIALVRSQRNLEQTEDLMSFMVGDLRAGLEPLGRLDLLEQVARKSREFYEQLPPGDVTPRSRRHRALTLENVGDVLRARGDARAALQSYELARTLHEPLWAADPDGTTTLRDRAVNASRIAEARMDLGDREAAEKGHAECVAWLQRLVDRDASADHLAPLASAHTHLGDLHFDQGEIERALESYRTAFGLRERRAALAPDSPDARRDLAAAHNCVADALKALGQPAAALQRYRTAVEIGAALVARDPGHARWQQDLAVSHTRIGDALLDDGDPGGAAESYGRALALYEGLFAREPAHTGWQRGLSVTHTGAGDAEARRGRRDEALEHYRRSLELDRNLAARDPHNTRWQRDLSVSLNRVGDALHEGGKSAEALPLYEESRAACRRLHERDPDHAQWRRDLSIALERVAGALQSLGRGADALARWREAQAHHEELLRREPANLQFRRDLSVVHHVIGRALAASGDYAAAVPEFRAAVGNHGELARQAPAQYGPELEQLEQTLAEAVRAEGLLSGRLTAATTADRLLLGAARHRRGEFEAACRELGAALEDPAARADLERGALQAAAAAAARAGGAWRARALEWLAEDVGLRRRRIAELEERLEVEDSGALRRQRQALIESLERVRLRDPDFASLRDDPAFAQLFTR
jgi:tetratricopeptide (TPR) repeat protein/tRNA A-37 threonylcarbamoyl transferase component Bud32